MKVSELMDPKGVLLYAKIDNSADARGILVELQEGIGVITNGNAYYNAVRQRETFGGTTAIGGGIALPHASNAGVSAPGISALLLRRGVDWGAPDGQPVDLVFMIAVPPKSESLHLQILARLVNLLGRRDLVEALRTASNPQRFVELIAKPKTPALQIDREHPGFYRRPGCSFLTRTGNIHKKTSKSVAVLYAFVLALNH